MPRSRCPCASWCSFRRDGRSSGACSCPRRERFGPNRRPLSRRIKAVLTHVHARHETPRMREDAWALRRHRHLSDEALIALVARGDDTALAELYNRIGRVAYGIALRI